MIERPQYHLYGLNIESEIDLPEALPNLEVANVDATIRFGNVDPNGLVVGERLGPFHWASPGAMWFHIPEVARYLVTRGSEIIIDPENGVDESSIRVFLLGSALGSMLLQRRLLVLHGNAIRIGDGCLICVGPSEVGKSTLAGEFMRRGYPILSDDVVPIDDKGLAFPGIPQIKLTEDAADRLDIKTEGLRAIMPNDPKFAVPLSAEQFCSTPVPVGWVYVLSPRQQDKVHISSLQGMKRLPALRENTYRLEFLEGMALWPDHLRLCGQLSSQARMSELSRPEDGGTVTEIADAILADIQENA
jgi:hypothetical protein